MLHLLHAAPPCPTTAALNNTTFTADELEAIELRGDDVDQSVVDLYGAGAAGTRERRRDEKRWRVGKQRRAIARLGQVAGIARIAGYAVETCTAQLTINKCDMLIAKQALRIDELERVLRKFIQ